MIEPPLWTGNQFEQDRQKSIVDFRRSRFEEPLEAYLEVFERYRDTFDNLLEMTVDLSQMYDNALEILTDQNLREALRYLTGPPISFDDLKTVAETNSLSKKRLNKDSELVRRVMDIILTALDRRRFPWVGGEDGPTESDRKAAVLASASLVATQRLGTVRRHEGKRLQEQRVADQLIDVGFEKVKARSIPASHLAPQAGQFCGESHLGHRKADFVIRLHDHRLMPIECKVSNSATNSVKRLNNDAAAKARVWREDLVVSDDG